MSKKDLNYVSTEKQWHKINKYRNRNRNIVRDWVVPIAVGLCLFFCLDIGA